MDWAQRQGVIGALGGVLLTGLIGLVTTELSHGWQREQRVEDRRQARADLRRDAYVAYLVQTQTLGEGTSVWMNTTGEAESDETVRVSLYAREMAEPTHEVDACERRVRLTAGKQVQDALTRYHDWFRHAVKETVLGSGPGLTGWDEHEAPLIEAMHRELEEDAGIPDR